MPKATVCVVETRTLCCLDHKVFEIRAGLKSSLLLECAVGYSYRDCLSEEIEILQLMLYRDEFVQDPGARKYCEPLLDKLEADIKELSDLESQLAT